MSWDLRRAMDNLQINRIPFDSQHADMCRGYSRERDVAINPETPDPVFVALHEMAHILLGHTLPNDADKISFLDVMLKEMRTPLSESEAHSVAMVAATELGISFDFERELEFLAHFMEMGGASVVHDQDRIREVINQIEQAGRE